MHYLYYARSLCTNFVPQGIRTLLLICPLGKAINQSWIGNAGRYTYNAFQTNIPEFWMKLLSQTHISNMCIFFFVENYIHLPCLRAGRPYVIGTKMNHATQRTNKKVSQLARDDMFDAKNKRGPTWPYMVRRVRPLHYDCGFPLLAGNLPPFHHPHFPTGAF